MVYSNNIKSLRDCVLEKKNTTPKESKSYTIGVLEGEGVGHELMQAVAVVLSSVKEKFRLPIYLEFFRLDSEDLSQNQGNGLTKDFCSFCEQIFSKGGAILSGPVCGRFVYDLRKKFDLFCKIAPVETFPEIGNSNRIKKRYLKDSNILIVRENIFGLYYGESIITSDAGTNNKIIQHTFSCNEKNVIRIIKVAVKLAEHRKNKLTVVVKDGGMKELSDLWRETATMIADPKGIDISYANVDFLSYDIIQNSADYDVVVAPNAFGDILVDIGGIIIGSRGLTYSGNFSSNDAAVYQTNHGACRDLEGQDKANPVGQIFSMAMLLRESFGLKREADLIELAVKRVWTDGWRTADIADNECRITGSRKMAELVAEAVMNLSGN